MTCIIIAIIVLYILYRLATAYDKDNAENTQSDETLEDTYGQVEEKHLTNEEILKAASSVLDRPYISDAATTAKELTESIALSPLKIEKFVGTVIIMTDYVEKIYIKDNRVYIAFGDGHYGTGSARHVINRYTCGITRFIDTIENLKPYDNIKIVGILDREHRTRQNPDILSDAMVLEINWKVIPEVEDFLREKLDKMQ